MKKICVLIGLFIIVSSSVMARPKTRGVEMDTIAHCSLTAMENTISKFCYQFQADPDELFSWAYLNTGSESPSEQKAETTNTNASSKNKRDESANGKDAIRLVYKDRKYDAKQRVGDVALDIYVLGSPMFRDNHLGSIYSQTEISQTQQIQQLIATYSGSLLEGGEIRFHLDSIAPNRVKVHYTFNLTFGRFLATFISDKTWRNVADWRFRAIFGNLVEYAETGKVTDRSAQ